MLTIKPHHFIDIIKLYGGGIEIFREDKVYKHDFARVANEIINNKNIDIKITTHNDDICIPCKYSSYLDVCTDTITHIEGIDLKNDWNKILDERIIKYANLSLNKTYSATELCKILYICRECIYYVWQEEPYNTKNYRYVMFSIGSEKFLFH